MLYSGGLTIPKKKETIECQKFTCSNPSCGKIFVNPIKAKNLASKKAEPYNACPYCLTEIVIDGKPSVGMESEQKPELKETEVEEPCAPIIEKRSTQMNPQTQKCAHHFGYLSKRSTKEKIPEECMMCENIVQCMLMNVTG
jgi:DNA-directed RNA polymerase subunit RPC12/RpoP